MRMGEGGTLPTTFLRERGGLRPPLLFFTQMGEGATLFTRSGEGVTLPTFFSRERGELRPPHLFFHTNTEGYALPSFFTRMGRAQPSPPLSLCDGGRA